MGCLRIVFRKMRLDLRRTKWKRGGYVESWVTTFDSGVIRKIAGGKAVKRTAVRLLRAQRYHGETHEETRGHLKEGGWQDGDEKIEIWRWRASTTPRDKHVDRNACIFRMSTHTYMPLSPPLPISRVPGWERSRQRRVWKQRMWQQKKCPKEDRKTRGRGGGGEVKGRHQKKSIEVGFGNFVVKR